MGTEMGVAERKAREFQQREEDILKAAYELFKVNGIETVTIDRIADEVEIGKGTIYQHFKSKHEIYAQLVLDLLVELQNELELIDKTLPVTEQAQQLIRVHLNFWLTDLDKHRVVHTCMNHLTMENLGPKLLKKVQDYGCIKHLQHYPLIEQAKKEGMLIDIPAEYAMLIAGGLMTGVADILADDNIDLKIGGINRNDIDYDLLYQAIETVLINGLMKP